MSIEAIDLELLKVLHLVLAERGVARAARRLHVTPSAVSNSLSRLRDVLHDPLVTRKGRGIVPTPRATQLAPAIARALHELDIALSGSRFDPATCARTFTLAIADVGQLAFGPRIATRLADELPQARLRMIGIDSLVSLGDLASSEIDLHVGLRGRGSALHFERLYEESTVLIAQRRRRVARHALETLHHVAVEMLPGRGLPDAVTEAYRRAGIRRDVVMTVPSFITAAAVVAATDLVATVPASFASAFGARFGVRIVAGPVPERHVEIGLSWHERTHADPASSAFRALVRRAVLATR